MFSDSRASIPDSGFRMEMSGHLIGVKDAGRRTNQRAAHAAPSALMEPKMLAARQNNDSQPVATAPICSKAILHISVQKPVGIDKVRRPASGSSDDVAFACFGLCDRLRTEIAILRHYDDGRGVCRYGWRARPGPGAHR